MPKGIPKSGRRASPPPGTVGRKRIHPDHVQCGAKTKSDAYASWRLRLPPELMQEFHDELAFQLPNFRDEDPDQARASKSDYLLALVRRAGIERRII